MSPYQNAPKDILFSIPHVVASISRSLFDHDLAQCSLVDWAWNQAFTHELYRREIHDRHFTTGVKKRDPWPVSPEFLASLKRHQSQIRFAKVDRWEFILFLREIQISTLKGLTTNNIVNMDDFEELLRSNKGVLERIVTDFTDWEPIEMPRLFTAEIHRLDRLTRLRFWTLVPASEEDNGAILGLILNNLPLSLQDLDLAVESSGRNILTPNDENIVELERPAQWKHQEMRSLKFRLARRRSSSKWIQWFLWQCPNLVQLGIQSTRYESATATACSVALKAGACPELETFESLSESSDPQGVQACLKAIKPGKLKVLKLMNLFGRAPMLEALTLHTPYLESLTMDRMPIESESIQEILTNSSHLQHFSMPTVSDRSRLQLRHLWTYPWICCHSLKTLSIQFTGGCSLQRADLKGSSLAVDPGLLRLYPKAHPTVLRIYVHLSSMTGLESLKIGVRHPYMYSEFVKAGVVGFDFSIRSGLPILSRLRRLRRLGFYQKTYRESILGLVEAQIGREEVDWMMRYWPALREIQLGIEQEKRPLAMQAQEVAQVAAEATIRAEEAESRLIELAILSETQTIESIADATEIIAAAEQARREADTAMEKARNAKARAAEDTGDGNLGPVTDWHSLIDYFPSWVKVRFWQEGDYTQW